MDSRKRKGSTATIWGGMSICIDFTLIGCALGLAECSQVVCCSSKKESEPKQQEMDELERPYYRQKDPDEDKPEPSGCSIM